MGINVRKAYKVAGFVLKSRVGSVGVESYVISRKRLSNSYTSWLRVEIALLMNLRHDETNETKPIRGCTQSWTPRVNVQRFVVPNGLRCQQDFHVEKFLWMLLWSTCATLKGVKVDHQGQAKRDICCLCTRLHTLGGACVCQSWKNESSRVL